MKKIIILTLLINILSCSNNKIEFFKSKVSNNLVLIKYPDVNSEKIEKQMIIDFVLENYKKDKDANVSFYKFTKNTEYFLTHKEEDSLGSNSLDYYNEDYIADYNVSRCENDSTKLVGLFAFGWDEEPKLIDNILTYNLKRDTLIFNCK